MLSGERLLKRLRHYPDIPACGRAVPRTKYPRTLQKGTGIFRSRSRLFLEGLFFLWVLHYFFTFGAPVNPLRRAEEIVQDPQEK
jgi:hypothetical protein